MKNINKKGFGLILAIVIVTTLLIMSIGFFQITDYSTKSTIAEINRISLYWAAESAANYNINSWVNNLEDSVRRDWPVEYTPPEEVMFMADGTPSPGMEGNTSLNAITTAVMAGGTAHYDTDGPYFDEGLFPGAKGTTTDGKLYLHASWLYDGHPKYNPDLLEMDGYSIYLTRYKGERFDHPDQAVWVLESVAYDPETKVAVKITMANIHNEFYPPDLAWLQNSEAIVNTLLGMGDIGQKGFFGENDYRYGDSYYSDIIKLNFATAGQDSGPHFYGTVSSGSSTIGGWQKGMGTITPFDPVGVGADYFHGQISTGLWKTSEDALASIMSSFVGGYLQDQEPLDPNGFMWEWEDIEEYSGASAGFGIYNVANEIGSQLDGTTTIDIVLNTTENPVGSGTYATTATISQGGITVATLPIGEGSGSWGMIAVPSGYGSVSIQGVSNGDFALATESSTVEIAGSFYLQDMEDAYNDLLNNPAYDFDNPTPELMAELYDLMAKIHPDGHLGLLSCLGNKDDELINEQAFLVTEEATILMTAAMISWNGAVSAGNFANATNNDLNFFNTGSVITLGSQTCDDPAGSSKWNYCLVEDERYSHSDEETFIGLGFSPNAIPNYTPGGLNDDYTWSKSQHGIESEGEIFSILHGTMY